MAMGYFNLGIQELRIAADNLKDPEVRRQHDEAAFKDFADSKDKLQQLMTNNRSRRAI